MQTNPAHRNRSMPRISRDSLMSLEAYSKVRKEFRARISSRTRKNRTVHLGGLRDSAVRGRDDVRLSGQEMLRAERTFERYPVRNWTLTTRSSRMAATGRRPC